MTELESIAGKIFSLLKGNNLQVKIFDDAGAETTDPSIGRRFFVAKPNMMITLDEDSNSIEFSKGKDVDNSVSSLQKRIRSIADEFLMNLDIKVFGKAIQPRDYAHQTKTDKGTMMENEMKPHNHHLVGKILHRLKHFPGTDADVLAQICDVTLSEIRPVLNQLVNTHKITADSGFQEGNIVYSIAMDEAVMESFSKMFGSLKTSHQTLESIRILVRHKVPVDENVRGARSRHISAIFLESNGERMRFPHNHLAGARAMAQHMAHGGTMNDKVGAYISESTGHLLKLQSFNRYVTTNNLINEDSSSIIDTIKESIQSLRSELKKITGSKTYETVKARLETCERETLAEDDISQLKDIFTVRRFDEKFEEVLPIVKQLVQEQNSKFKRIEEAACKDITLRSEVISSPIFEFASTNAQLGFKIGEFALRIMENEELSKFVSNIGTKLCKEGTLNSFECEVMKQIFENSKVEKKSAVKELNESFDLSAYFDRFDYKFM